MKRYTIIAANWKMHLRADEARQLADAIALCRPPEHTRIILAPPFVYLYEMVQRTASHPHIHISAQNCSQFSQGAYTGEVAAFMLQSIGCKYVIIGHSERRKYFGETDAIVYEKMLRAIENDLTPILCCGEPLDVRQQNQHREYVFHQLQNTLFHLDERQLTDIILAYEPIWAIGTGIAASTEQIQEMHHFIRQSIAEHYGSAIAQQCYILYGGSVKPQNATEILSLEDVDGALVGGASLQADSFCAIVRASAAHRKD